MDLLTVHTKWKEQSVLAITSNKIIKGVSVLTFYDSDFDSSSLAESESESLQTLVTMKEYVWLQTLEHSNWDNLNM